MGDMFSGSSDSWPSLLVATAGLTLLKAGRDLDTADDSRPGCRRRVSSTTSLLRARTAVETLVSRTCAAPTCDPSAARTATGPPTYARLRDRAGRDRGVRRHRVCVLTRALLDHRRYARSPPGDPQHVAALPVGVAGQDEEQVREPVEVGQRQRVHRVRVLGVRRPGGALRAAYDRAGDVQVGGGRRAAAEDERAQRLQRLVVVVAPLPRAGRRSPARPAAAGTPGPRRPGSTGRRPRRTGRSARGARTAATSSSRSPTASATPMWALASSTSA